jgi:hypothetical protein
MPRQLSLFYQAATGALVLGIAFGAPMSAQSVTTQIDIANMPVGMAPPGFEFTLTGGGPASAWKLVSDPTAAGQKAIAQTSQDRTDYRFPLAVYLSLGRTSM